MKKMRLVACAAIAALLSSCQQKSSMTLNDCKTEMDSVSYAFGTNVGVSLNRSISDERAGFPHSEELNRKAIVAAISEALLADSAGLESLPMTHEEAMEYLQAFLEKDKQQKIEEGRAKEETFMNENAQKEGVKQTESGLQYKVISEGPKGGIMPNDTSFVTVHYTGRFINGDVFDSSIERGEPAEFPVMGVVPGFAEGLKLMKVGDKFELYIPARLGYGEDGSGRMAPMSTLIFEIEMLGVSDAPKRPRPGRR